MFERKGSYVDDSFLTCGEKAETANMFKALFLAGAFCISSVVAFQQPMTHNRLTSAPSNSNTALFDGDGTGGWGIGSSRGLTPEEFARGDRRAFDGYEMRERGDFLRQLKDEQDSLMKSEMDELLGVAKIAGISVKNPKDRLNKFDTDLIDDDDEDLDLSV